MAVVTITYARLSTALPDQSGSWFRILSVSLVAGNEGGASNAGRESLTTTALGLGIALNNYRAKNTLTIQSLLLTN
jgi:hypothetical protein